MTFWAYLNFCLLFLLSACNANEIQCQYYDVWGKEVIDMTTSYSNPEADARIFFLKHDYKPYFIYYEGGRSEVGLNYENDVSYPEYDGGEHFSDKNFETMFNFYRDSSEFNKISGRLISITNGLKKENLAERGSTLDKKYIDSECYRSDLVKNYIDKFNYTMLVEFHKRNIGNNN